MNCFYFFFLEQTFLFAPRGNFQKTNSFNVDKFCHIKIIVSKQKQIFFKKVKTFFLYQDFLSQTLTIQKTAGEQREPSLFLSTTLTHSPTSRYLFSILHVG